MRRAWIRGDPSRRGAASRRCLTLSLVALLVSMAWGMAPVPGAAAGGSVQGSIEVAQATLRTEGPKHDRDVVVMLQPVDGAELPPASERVHMDQKGLVFLPHVFAIQKGTTVTFLNSDNDQHNVYFLDDESGETLDIGTWGPGVSVDHTFEKPGMVITLCKLHLEMAAYIVVVDGPWFTVAELDGATLSGSYLIEGVPPGAYELSVWHKKLKQKGGAVTVEVAADGVREVDVIITKAKYARSSP